MPRTVTEDSLPKILNDYEARIRALERTQTTSTSPGGGGGGVSMPFAFPVAAAIWNINHNLDRFPSVTVVDSAGIVLLAHVTYLDSNNIRVEFAGATAGTAYLN